MTSALQRVVPTQDERGARPRRGQARPARLGPPRRADRARSSRSTPRRSPRLFSAAPEDAARLPGAIAFFAWALPLWTFVEVATSAARARRAFGPEIRLRIFWEQIARIVLRARLLRCSASTSIGLMLAHLCSLALTALLCVPLLGRYYDLRPAAARADRPARWPASCSARASALLPSNLVAPAADRRAAAGAQPDAARARAAPRRPACSRSPARSRPCRYIVRQSFQYVLGAARPRPRRMSTAPQVGAALPFRQPRLDRAGRAARRPAHLRRRRHPQRLPARGGGGACRCSGSWSRRAASRRSSARPRRSSR